MNLTDVVGGGRHVLLTNVEGVVLASQVDLGWNLHQPSVGVMLVKVLPSGSKFIVLGARVPCSGGRFGAVQKLNLLSPPDPHKDLPIVEASVWGRSVRLGILIGAKFGEPTLDIHQGSVTSPRD